MSIVRDFFNILRILLEHLALSPVTSCLELIH